MSSAYSIYIPRMLTTFCECVVSEYFEKLMGKVSRVDFTPINKKPGFEENIDGENYKSAFVHFSYLHEDDYKTETILNELENGRSFRLDLDGEHDGTYWLLLKNKNPIPDTLMNNAQIVENCRLLEQKVAGLNDQLEGARNVIYQLVGGLFNQETQSGMIDMHNDTLFPECEQNFNYDNNINREVIWPTTRQGDELEKNVQEQRKRISELSCELGYVIENDIRPTTNKTFELEKKLDAQEKVIKQQAETIDELSGKIHITQHVIRHLLDGIYHQHKQRKTIRALNNTLYQIDPNSNPYLDEIDPYDNFPTTRQGDELERKVAQLEKQLEDMKAQMMYSR